MRHELTNELEERRVVRLIAGAAETVGPLSDIEIETLLLRTSLGTDRRRARSCHRHVLSAAALAAAAALAVSLPLGGKPADEPSGGPSSAARGLVAFPEGSALELLLSRGGAENA